MPPLGTVFSDKFLPNFGARGRHFRIKKMKKIGCGLNGGKLLENF
jgi:hypothetical protein